MSVGIRHPRCPLGLSISGNMKFSLYIRVVIDDVKKVTNLRSDSDY